MKGYLFLTILVFLFTLPSWSSANDFDQLLRKEHSESGFSGSVLIARGEQKVFAGAIGMANKSWSIPADVKTRYVIASLTKSMTAALVLALADKESLDLTANIRTYLPNYPAEYADTVTVLQLLRHKSGIPNFNALEGWFDGAFLREIRSDEFLNAVAAMPLVSPPGTAYHYSNGNYLLLSEVVAAVTGKSFAASLQMYVLDPLDMKDTGIVLSDVEIVDQMAQNYRILPQGVQKGGAVNIAHFIGSASNYSTVHDLRNFVTGIQADKIFGSNLRGLMLDAAEPIGWNVSEVVLHEGAPPSRVISYNGELEGYNSMVTYADDDEITVVVLNNNDQGYERLRRITQELIGILLKL